jgi:transposase
MLYSGIDIHKRFSVITTLDQQGQLIAKAKVKNKPELINQYFNKLDQDTHKAVIEACFAWGWLADQLEDSKIQIMLANPQKTKAIASARIKTDSVDSKILADLLRSDFIAPSHYTPKADRDLQELIRSRARLVFTRSSLKHKLSSILHKHNLNPEWDDLEITDMFGKTGRKWMASKLTLLPPHTQFVFTQILESIDDLKRQIDEFSQRIDKTVPTNATATMLAKLPGLGNYSALLLAGEIGDITRFRTPENLCSFAGLVPSVYQSGDKARMGRIKPGNKYVRWILLQAAPKAIHKDRHLAAFYLKLARKKGSKKAKVATARKMLSQIHWILTHNQLLYQEPGTPAYFSDSRGKATVTP